MAEPLPRHARRLLDALAADGADARETAARPGFLAVAVARRGVTSVTASLPREAAAPLVAQGLAVWRGDRLLATAAGLAHLRREAAPDDPFQAQHRAIETRDMPGEGRVSVDAAESPLAWLARRAGRGGKPFLDAQEVEAGERFRRDVTVAQWLPSVTSNWSAQGASGGSRGDPSRLLLPSEAALAARQRIDRALGAVGPDFAGLILDACGFVKKLETIETERAWPARSAKIVLKLALGSLARHYGLAAAAVGPARGAMRAWSAADQA